jgi:hypothetical protein
MRIGGVETPSKRLTCGHASLPVIQVRCNLLCPVIVHELPEGRVLLVLPSVPSSDLCPVNLDGAAGIIPRQLSSHFPQDDLRILTYPRHETAVTIARAS